MRKLRPPLDSRRAVLLVFAALAAGAVVGCGDGGGATNPPAGGQAQQTHRDSGGGSGQFRVPDGDNSIQEFGAEASEAEMQAAAAALHSFLDARVAKDWKAACEYLAAGTRQQLEQLARRMPKGGAADCPHLLATLSAASSPLALREAAIADVGSLRVEGSRGFLLYHGAHGAAYAIQVLEEDGAWRMSGLVGVPLE